MIVTSSRVINADLFIHLTIAHDKGKPVARQGRKAVSLLELELAHETVWLPKAIREGSFTILDCLCAHAAAQTITEA